MFFHTSALTVGMMKNGAIIMMRTMLRPKNGLIEKKRQKRSANDADGQDPAHQLQRISHGLEEGGVGQEIGVVGEAGEAAVFGVQQGARRKK